MARLNVFVVALALIYVIAAESLISYYDGPKIDPSGEYAVVMSGENITLRCEGKEPLTWDYGGLEDYENESNIHIYVSNTSDERYPYGTLLNIVNATVNNLGYYSCMYNRTDYYNMTQFQLEELELEGQSKRIYLFVNDSVELIKNSTEIVIRSIEYKNIVIPCIPTSPDVVVTLYLADEKVIPNQKMKKLNNRKVTYNKYSGFTIPDAHLQDGNFLYNCTGTRQGTVSQYFFVDVQHVTDFVPTPNISHTDNGKSIVGGEIHLNCSIEVEDSITFRLDWEVPNKHIEPSRINKTRAKKIVDKKKGYTIGVSSLTLWNITKADQGNYVCKVVDHNNNTNSNEQAILIYENGTSFIIFKDPANLKAVNVKKGKTAQILVHIDAFPPPIITWYDNKRKEIISDWIDSPTKKYKIFIKPDKTMLNIFNTTLTDTGVYQLKGDNGISVQTFNITVFVLDAPKINCFVSHFYKAGSKAHVLCTVDGYPLPEIEWYFQSCDDALNCTSPLQQLQKTDYSIEEISMISVKTIATLLVEKSGKIICSAKNKINETKVVSNFHVTDVDNGFAVTGKKDPIASGDMVNLTCSASKYMYSNNIKWYKFINNSKVELYKDQYGYKIIPKSTPYSHQVLLFIPNITKQHSGSYECLVESKSEDKTNENQIVKLDVFDVQKPYLESTNMNGTEVSYEIGVKEVYFECKGRGMPIPTITWEKDGNPINMTKDRVTLTEDRTRLHFDYILKEDIGQYRCIVSNRIATVERYMSLYTTSSEFKTTYIIIIVVLMVVFLTLISVLSYKIRKEKKLITIAGLLHFEDGATESLNPELGVDDQAELLPYDKKWEFPREKLKFGKQLGSGAFGVVKKAVAQGIIEEEESTTVAVKMVKGLSDPALIKALASELKIMIHLGKHLNVVNLLGACTKNVTKRELLVIVEYCRFGNLRDYLLKNRHNFIDQIDRKTDLLDPSIGSEIITRALSVSSNKSVALKSASQPLLARSVSREDSCYNSNGIDTGNTVISMVPNGDDGPITSSGSVQPDWRSNYRGDYYSKEVRPITTHDLLCWSFQVARGMEYLARRNVLHGDLAARNILLSNENIVKICDFGLAKNMYKTDNYKKKGNGPLPVKWMAIESITDKVFSTQSDVWSYGIVLWELFSLAKTPYPGMEANAEFYKKLNEGYRMDKPEYANHKIYEVMLECWRSRPNQRPTFSELDERLGSLLEDTVRKHYIDLNDPYVDMNNRWLADRGQSDYLAMMNAPDYNNFVSDAVHQYENDPFGGSTRVNPSSPDEVDVEGYLLMNPAKPKEENPDKNNIMDSMNEHETDAKKPELVPMLVLHSPTKTTGSNNEVESSLTEKPNSPHPENDMYENLKDKPFEIPNGKENIPIAEDNYLTMNKETLGNTSFSNPSYVVMHPSYQPSIPNIYKNIPPNIVT